MAKPQRFRRKRRFNIDGALIHREDEFEWWFDVPRVMNSRDIQTANDAFDFNYECQSVDTSHHQIQIGKLIGVSHSRVQGIIIDALSTLRKRYSAEMRLCYKGGL